MYTFVQEKSEAESISYAFVTKNSFIYTVLFDISTYVDYVHQYPCLLKHGYFFGFYKKLAISSDEKFIEDSEVFETISAIIIDFFKNIEPNAVLLYHCDYEDGKQEFRNRLFNSKFDLLDSGAEYKKDTVEVEVDINSDGALESMYIGYIVSKENSELENIQNEFQSFATEIIINQK